MKIRPTLRWAIRLVAVVGLASVLSMPDTADAERRMVFEVTEVEGEVQRPQVSVLITRQNLNDPYDLELKESFLPKIVEALDEAPF